MKLSKCQADKDRRRIEDCELAAITAVPLATINVSSRTQAASPLSAGSDGGDAEGNDQTIPMCTTRPVLRVWGGRPFQSPSDNSAQAREYWSQVADLKLKKQIKLSPAGSSLNLAVLNELRQLTPGSGPGVPLHLPLSYENIPTKIVSITCGEAFFATLTASGEVYIAGHGLLGELGLGPKIGAMREPHKLNFERSAPVASSGDITEPEPKMVTSQQNSLINELSLPEDATETVSPVFNVDRLTPSVLDDVVIQAISAGRHHCLALTDEGEVYVWGQASACGLMTVDNLLWPTSMRKYEFAASRKPIRAIAAQGGKSAMLSDDGAVYIWGSWSGIAPLMRPLEVARLQLEDYSIRSAQMALGDTMGLICVRLSHMAERSLLYQIGVGVRNEILAVDHTNDDPEIPKFQRVCEERYQMYVPECVSPHICKHSGVGCQDVTSIAVGNRHAVVLTSDARMLAWGDNTWGQCGIAGDRQTHVSEPTVVIPRGDVVPVQIFAGGEQSALITNTGSLYAWGCTRDHRLANSGIKCLAEAPIRALAGGKPGSASLVGCATVGATTEASVQDSIFQPERVLALAPLKATAVGMGQTYMAVATGDGDGSVAV